jgi:integrative and conjugative element protein (TIGR02256 family)
MAEGDRYSDAFPAADLATLSEPIRAAISEIEAAAASARVLMWNPENPRFVAVAVDLRIDLPTRGPIDGLDIRRTEPVIFLLDRRDYPHDAPEARIDRVSFPADKLPHLNPVPPGQPPSMCLHRGSIDDWFAEHNVRELVERVRGWYRDAASGRLMRQGDVFEPTRLHRTKCTMVFSAKAISGFVARRWVTAPEAGYTFAFARLGGDGVKHTGWAAGLSISLLPFLLPDPPAELLDTARELNDLSTDPNEIPRATLAICAWRAPQPVDTYFGQLPSTYGELLSFADGLGIPLRAAMADLAARDAQLLKCVPIALAIPRPRPLQGTGALIEWLCFGVVSDGERKDDDVVLSLGHREPLTPDFARALSAVEKTDRLERPLVLGCGAIGSKVALHLAKAGFVAQRVVDHATLTPHNVVRHGLLGNSLGKPKADALRDEIIGLYPGQRDLGTESLFGSVADALADSSKLEDRTLLLDATASSSVQNQLIDAQLPASVRVCRIEIAVPDHLGVLAYEGDDRNPRLDDLQLHLFDMARTDPLISSWLRTHAKDEPTFEDIGIGLGCSSATFRIADDVVSHNAAAFSRSLRKLAKQDRGHLVLVGDGDATPTTRAITIPRVTVLAVEERPEWTVRVAASVVSFTREHLDVRKHKESGGLLVGYVNLKRKIVYVSHALAPSRDSHGTRAGFTRGVEGYPADIREVEERTGGILGYVGEWHTHPEGSTAPSPIDRGALAEIQQRLDAAGIPGVIVIVGPQSITAAMHPDGGGRKP